MLTSRQKLLATIIGSYVTACLATSVCLLVVTARYEMTVADAENRQIDGVLNRLIDDRIWGVYADKVNGLARDIAQENSLRRLLGTSDFESLQNELPQLGRRSVVTTGEISLLGVAVVTSDGAVAASDGAVPMANQNFDISGLLSARRGVERLKVMTQVWLCEGTPILTVIHPIGGLRPIGYAVVHASPLRALSGLDRHMGMGLSFWNLDRSKQLSTFDGRISAETNKTIVTIRAPDGSPIMSADVEHDVAQRLATMWRLRTSAFGFLLGILAAVATVTIATILLLTRRMVNEETFDKCSMAMENMPQGLCMFDGDGSLIICNRRYLEMYGLPPEWAKPGIHFHDIVERRVANGIYSGERPEIYLDNRLAVIRDRNPATLVDYLPDGRVICVSYRPMPDGGWLGTHDDITERIRIEAQIAHMAHHDALTDLPNRTLLRERLDQALQDQLRDHQSCAILILDLDRFKEVNDGLGHPIGDALLKMVASRLRNCAGDADTVARLGGDEFAILQRMRTGALDSDALARRVVEMIGEPFDIDGHHLSIGTSIGISVAPRDGMDPDQLIKNADLALYRAKSIGRGTYQFFEPALDQLMQQRRTLEKELRQAIVNEEFELHYQPLVNLESDEICGFEALLRWNRPGQGLVSPAQFIPLAEETGLINQIGQWVLKQACLEAVSWPDHLHVAVNVSPVQFKSKQFVLSVLGTLGSSGLSANRLELEITESAVLEDADGAFATLDQLRRLGVRLALDDFGTGYSSLASLQRFPFHKIKIDRSFVSDMSLKNPSAHAIVQAVAGLGIGLGMQTTAEGVETRDQLDQIRALGCTEYQGYLCSRPVPAHEISRLIGSLTKAGLSA